MRYYYKVERGDEAYHVYVYDRHYNYEVARAVVGTMNGAIKFGQETAEAYNTGKLVP